MIVPKLSLYLFGPPRIELNGIPLPIQRNKAIALLAYLAVTKLPHSRDALATLFWPGYDQTHARDNLRRTLSALYQTLNKAWLAIDRQRILLPASENLWVDVNRFQHQLASCHRHGHPLDQVCPACVPVLNDAVTLYTDDFLRGFTLPDSPEFDEWQAYETERLRTGLASALERLAQAYSGQGNHSAAIEYTRRRVALDPAHEPAQRQLIALYVQAGQPTAALRQYQICVQTLADELGILPGAETQNLYEEIQRGELWAGQAPPAIAPSLSMRQPTGLAVQHHNLPTQTTPFVGREAELAKLAALLANPAIRLVTILGPGGMGKTRLALEAAKQYLKGDQQWVFFVPLAPLQAGASLASVIAAAIGYPVQPDERALEQQLLDYLQQKQMWLVLDNFEHLIEGASFVHDILQAAPGVRILATSRERMRLSAETVFSLGGLECPTHPTDEDALKYNAVKLFLQSARRVRPDFDGSTTNVTDITRICQLVAGMPLGIELAAAWVDLLSPQEISTEINQSLDFLETQFQDVPERQRSLRVIFMYSWGRLTEPERAVLMQLTVFRGGFTRQAAETVAGASLQSLSALVNKALLQREVDGRYAIHELLRQYAEAELQATTELGNTTRNRHCAYYTSFLGQRKNDLKGHRQKAVLNEIDAEFENIQLAWHWSSERGYLQPLAQAIESLGLYYEWHGRLQEGERSFARTAEQLTKTGTSAERRLMANVLIWQARFSRGLGHSKQVRHLLEQSLALLNTPMPAEHDTRPEQAAILMELGYLAYDSGDRQEASAQYARSLALYRDLGDRWREAKVLLALEGVIRNLHGQGDAKQHQQQTKEAQSMVLESLATFRELGDQASVAAGLLALGVTFLTLGQPKEAQPVLEECIVLCQELGSHSNTLIDAIGYLGVAQEFLGLYDQMRVQGQSLLTLAQETGYWHGLRLAYYLTGAAALAEQAYQEAEQWLQKNVALNRGKQEVGQLAFALTGWALSTYWLGDATKASQQLAEALQIAAKIRAIRPAAHGLILAALLLTGRGECERAVELHALTASYPFVANSRWCQAVAGWRLEAVAAALPTDVVTAAQTRGHARDVWVTVEELLIELAEDKASNATGH